MKFFLVMHLFGRTLLTWAGEKTCLFLVSRYAFAALNRVMKSGTPVMGPARYTRESCVLSV